MTNTPTLAQSYAPTKHQSASASILLLNQQLHQPEPIDTFLGDLVVLADNMISSTKPDIFLEFPRISSQPVDTWHRINHYLDKEEYPAFLSNEEQTILILLILQSNGVPYEYYATN